MHQPTDIIRDNLGQEFCYIPEGRFLGGIEGNEELQTGAPTYVGRYPVTVALFMAFLSDTGYDYPQTELNIMQDVSPMPECPACNISWLDAKEFCRWLRKKTGDYYSLPQNDEWEKAARGEDGRHYPWGNEEGLEHHAHFNSMHIGTTSQVGQKPQGVSPYGCHDMAGNVWEWCLDSFTDERDPHILKGGSWQNEAEYLDCGVRTYSYPPEKRRPYMGFRLLYLTKDMLDKYKSAYFNS